MEANEKLLSEIIAAIYGGILDSSDPCENVVWPNSMADQPPLEGAAADEICSSEATCSGVPSSNSTSLTLMGELNPHIAMAARLRRELEALRARTAWLEGALNQLSARILLCDGEGKVLFANESAELMLRQADPVRRTHTGHLLAANPSDALQRALQRAVGSNVAEASTVILESSGDPVVVWTIPMPVHHELARLWQFPLAMVWLQEEKEARSADHIMLRSIYGLTEAECRLADLIYLDLSPLECAETLGVAVTTVRSQIRSMYAKLGCKRQTTFIHILKRFHPPA